MSISPARSRRLDRFFLPWPTDRRPRRLAQLFAGLLLYGLSIGMLVRAQLGLDPWDALHQGLNKVTGLTFGTITILVGFVVLLVWIPLRQRLGFGTLANAVVVGVAVDVTLSLIPDLHAMAWRIPSLLGGVLLTALAAALYIGAGFGPGPRDGLMTGMHARGLGSLRLVRTAVEVLVLVIGWLLGGSVGFGTVLFAVAIGPLIQLFLPWFTIDRAAPVADDTQEGC